LTRLESLDLDEGRTMNLVRAPVALNATLNRFVGDLLARRWARAFNSGTVRNLARRLKVDAVFHGDGFYYFPESLDNRLPVFSDIQDNFDAPESPTQIQEYVYGKHNFGRCRANFAVGSAAAKRFGSLMSAHFQVVPNGVHLKTFQAAAGTQIAALRARLGLADRYVISYIGTASHIDRQFVLELAGLLADRMPDATLMVVGPGIASRGNIVATDFVHPADVHAYFLASDLGLCPAPQPESNFIYHAVPLKVVQYGAARKFVLSVPNLWLEENSFPNVQMAPLDAAEWADRIVKLRALRWEPAWDEIWNRFDWDSVARPVVEAVRAAV
jgi:glycosyltransferase involved in cell wall biosynthesis